MGRLFPAKYFTSILHSKMENPKRKLIAHVKPTVCVQHNNIFYITSIKQKNEQCIGYIEYHLRSVQLQPRKLSHIALLAVS
jgi:hypothetical protein